MSAQTIQANLHNPGAVSGAFVGVISGASAGGAPADVYATASTLLTGSPTALTQAIWNSYRVVWLPLGTPGAVNQVFTATYTVGAPDTLTVTGSTALADTQTLIGLVFRL